MLFNVKPGAKAVAKSADWTLLGEKVEVEDSYVYLGTITQRCLVLDGAPKVRH